MSHITKISVLIVCFLTLNSCGNQSPLEKHFDCKTAALENLKKIHDFNKNFSLNVPENWKTNYYYSNVVSEVFVADTTRQLSESYIFNASHHMGELVFDSKYIHQRDSILKKNAMELLESENIEFKGKTCSWYLVKGLKNGYPVHQFNMVMLLSGNTYFSTATEIYGTQDIDKRLCSSFSVLNSLEFLE